MSKDDTNVSKFNFTEGWFRDSGIYDLSQYARKKTLSKGFEDMGELVRLGWNQTRVVDLFGMKQLQVNQIINNFDNEISNIQHQFFQKKKSIEEPRDLKIWKLVRLGRAKKGVGELYNMTPENVGVIQNKLDKQVSLVQQQYFQKKKSVEGDNHCVQIMIFTNFMRFFTVLEILFDFGEITISEHFTY